MPLTTGAVPRAEVGLILTEGTVVDRPAAKNEPAVPHFHGAALDGWKQVVDAVHDAGGKIAPQLWHAGASPRAPRADWAPRPIDSPSGLGFDGSRAAEPMSESAIADTIQAFARSAAEAVAIGCDAIELHGAHGYLIDQFFWNVTNHRDDGWGGASLAERSRFAAEIVRAVRAAIGPETVLCLRLSQWKIQDFGAQLAGDAGRIGGVAGAARRRRSRPCSIARSAGSGSRSSTARTSISPAGPRS